MSGKKKASITLFILIFLIAGAALIKNAAARQETTLGALMPDMPDANAVYIMRTVGVAAPLEQCYLQSDEDAEESSALLDLITVSDCRYDHKLKTQKNAAGDNTFYEYSGSTVYTVSLYREPQSSDRNDDERRLLARFSFSKEGGELYFASNPAAPDTLGRAYTTASHAELAAALDESLAAHRKESL